MNSMSNGFLYTLGLGWVLVECCLRAAAGSWLPAALFLLGFVIIFAIFGCLDDLSTATVEKSGAVFAAVLAAVLVLFTVQTFIAGSIGLGILKLVFAAVFVLGAAALFSERGKSGDGAHH